MPPAAAVNRMLFIQDTYFSTVTGHFSIPLYRRSQWPRGLRRRSVAAHLLRLWVRIPPGAWMLVCCECRVLSGRGLCDGLITPPEESYRLWCVVVCELETSRMRRPWPALGRSATEKKTMSNCYSLHATSAVGSFLSSGKLVCIIRVMKTNLMH